MEHEEHLPRKLRKNVILFITDQERATQHFPPDWERENLPGLTRLKQNGLTFENAFTNACMCSPARVTCMTGYFPAQHGVKYTLEESMPAPDYPQVEMPLSLANIATVMSATGYNVVYKGKWHCNKPAGEKWVPQDVGQYGFTRWNPQDAGANQNIDQAGGGNIDNDGRFMNDDGDWQDGAEGVLAYLTSAATMQQPFFMIVSLVNPHDVLFYPSTYVAAGYDDSWLAGDIGIPVTVDEDLSTKPTAQQQILALGQAMGQLSTPEMKRDYLNFYGNLIKSSDNYLVEVLDKLEEIGLLQDTLIIRTADHGEMGLTHGGQRQKNFLFYEEVIRVPLIFSNPELYRRPVTSSALVSHVDFLPTLANLFGAPVAARAAWQGVDYSSLVLNPSDRDVQDYVVFTYDDYQSGQPQGPYPTPPNHIVSIREARYKLAEYYDVAGQVPSQWEMYDLWHDPLERKNLAYEGCQRSPHEQEAYERLRLKLQAVKASRLQPLD
ncbi:MAG: hypothetical protein Fur0021_18010 [Candidatus Promineifilaceae bacterium]